MPDSWPRPGSPLSSAVRWARSDQSPALAAVLLEALEAERALTDEMLDTLKQFCPAVSSTRYFALEAAVARYEAARK